MILVVIALNSSLNGVGRVEQLSVPGFFAGRLPASLFPRSAAAPKRVLRQQEYTLKGANNAQFSFYECALVPC